MSGFAVISREACFPSLVGAAGRAAQAPSGLSAGDTIVLVDSSSLAATSAVPWNVLPAPDPSRRGASGAPARAAVSLPSSGLGYVAHRVLNVEQRTHLFTALAHPHLACSRVSRMVDRRTWNRPGLEPRTPRSGALKSRVPRRDDALNYQHRSAARAGHQTAVRYDWAADQFYGVGREASSDSPLRDAARVRAPVYTGSWDANGGPASPGRRSRWGGRQPGDAKAASPRSRTTLFPALGTTTLDRWFENFVYGAACARPSRGPAALDSR
jgi:hypothetical protein